MTLVNLHNGIQQKADCIMGDIRKCICGSENQHIEVDYYGEEQVVCESCGMRGPLKRTNELAVKRWNYIISKFNQGECIQW